MPDNTRIVYAVEAVVPSEGGGVHSGYQFHFGDDTLRNLWRDLRAGCQETAQAESPNSQSAMAQRSSLSQLSRLAPTADVPVIYSAEDLRALSEECRFAAPQLRDPKAQSLMRDLATTTEVALQAGGELVAYQFGSSDTPRPQRESLYTIEVRLFSGDTITRLFTAQIQPDSLRMLWKDLGITTEHWNKWEQGLATKYVPLDERLPQLSGLASVEEGAIKYQGSEVEELLADCERARPMVRTSEAQRLLDYLINACTVALHANAQVAIHPFGLPK